MAYHAGIQLGIDTIAFLSRYAFSFAVSLCLWLNYVYASPHSGTRFVFSVFEEGVDGKTKKDV